MRNDQVEQVCAQSLRVAVAIQRLGGPVPEHDRAVHGIALDRDAGNVLHQQTETLLTFAQRFFHFPAFGNVARKADGANQVAVHRDRRLVGFNPAQLAVDDDFFFKMLAGVSGQHGTIIGAVFFRHFRRDDVQIALADQRRRRRPADAAGKRFVDGEEAALLILQPDHEGKSVEQGAQVLFTLAQRVFGDLALFQLMP